MTHSYTEALECQVPVATPPTSMPTHRLPYAPQPLLTEWGAGPSTVQESRRGPWHCGDDLDQLSPPRFSHPWYETGTPYKPPFLGLGPASNATSSGESCRRKPHAAPRGHPAPALACVRPRPRALPAICETKASATRDMSAGRPAPAGLVSRGPQRPPTQLQGLLEAKRPGTGKG